MTNMLAIDMGSSSIRGYVAQTDDSSTQLTEIYRHRHQVHKGPTGYVWDVPELCRSAVEACEKATMFLGAPPDSVAIDGWGVDFVPVDSHGNPCGEAYAYRDPRGQLGRALLSQKVDESSAFQLSGVAPQDINSINRFVLYARDMLPLPAETDSLMFLQDVVARHLATAPIQGWDAGTDPQPWASSAVASTSGALSASHQDWSPELIGTSGLNPQYLPAVQPELSIICTRGRTRLIRAGSHDTACAAYALDAHLGDMFVSCGSWAVVGVVTPEAIVTEDAYAAGITNEACVDGNNRAQLNLTGMWLAQECERHWKAQGIDTSYARLDPLIEQAPSLGWVFDPQDERFATPGDMPSRIINLVRHERGDYLTQHGINIEDPGVLLRLVYESVAASIADGIRVLRDHTSSSGKVYICGGATHNAFFVRCLSAALEEELTVAPAEATVAGNIRAQATVLGVTQQISF